VKWAATPPDLLPLPVAEMDFPVAEPIRAVLHDAVSRSDLGYAYAAGRVGEALAGFAERRWDWTLDPAGVRGAPDLAVAAIELLRAIAPDGGTVVANPPVYNQFFHWVRRAGLDLDPVDLVDGEIDLDALEAAFARRPVAYLLCSPHNPTGTVHSPATLRRIVDLAHEHDVIVVADEVHAPLTHGSATFTPLLTLDGAAEVTVTLTSASKSWNLAGLKCAQIVSASPRTRAVTDRIDPDVEYQQGHLGVLAAVAAYEDGVDWLDDAVETIEARVRLLGGLLTEQLPWVRWAPPRASYLAWLDLGTLGDGAAPWERARDEAGVLLGRGPDFGDPGAGHVRVNVATSAEILSDAVERLATLRP